MRKELPEAVCDGLREELRQFLAIRPDITITELAYYTKLSEHTARAFLNGNCPGGHEVVNELRSVLGQAGAGDILSPGRTRGVMVAEQQQTRVQRTPRRHQFHETSLVRHVGEVLDYCALNAAIGMIVSDFGTGKTEAVSAWRRGRGRKIENRFFGFNSFTNSNKVFFVQELARMFGIRVTLGSQFAGPMFREVCQHLRENPLLIIFDQAEVVRARVFQIIREIWDETHEEGVGIVILAAPVLLARLSRSGMADLGALTSRVGLFAPLAGVTRAEMGAIAKAEGITDVDEAAFDLWWKNTSGSMRRLMASIDLLKAKHSGKRVSERTVSGVSGHLWGMSIREREAAA